MSEQYVCVETQWDQRDDGKIVIGYQVELVTVNEDEITSKELGEWYLNGDEADAYAQRYADAHKIEFMR